MKLKKILLGGLILTSICSTNLEAAKRKKIFRTECEANSYLIEHFNRAVIAYNASNWKTSADEFEKITRFFPGSTEASKSYFYLGVSFFELKEYDFANWAFSSYLETASLPEHFQETLQYKFFIAENLKSAKRRPFTVRYLPKCVTGESMAIEIYDEIIAIAPTHDLAVESLYAKANLLKCMRDYRQSIETYEILIRKFPMHELTPVCYLDISETFYLLSKLEFQNPDILELTEVNNQKFADSFPRDDRVALAEQYADYIKEVYARGLCNVGLFYERTKHPEAAAIYYQTAIEQYPQTKVASYCRCLLNKLDYTENRRPKVISDRDDLERSAPTVIDPLNMYEPEPLPINDFD